MNSVRKSLRRFYAAVIVGVMMLFSAGLAQADPEEVTTPAEPPPVVVVDESPVRAPASVNEVPAAPAAPAPAPAPTPPGSSTNPGVRIDHRLQYTLMAVALGLGAGVFWYRRRTA